MRRCPSHEIRCHHLLRLRDVTFRFFKEQGKTKVEINVAPSFCITNRDAILCNKISWNELEKKCNFRCRRIRIWRHTCPLGLRVEISLWFWYAVKLVSLAGLDSKLNGKQSRQKTVMKSEQVLRSSGGFWTSPRTFSRIQRVKSQATIPRWSLPAYICSKKMG